MFGLAASSEGKKALSISTQRKRDSHRQATTENDGVSLHAGCPQVTAEPTASAEKTGSSEVGKLRSGGRMAWPDGLFNQAPNHSSKKKKTKK